MNWDRFVLPIFAIFSGICLLFADEGKWISTLKTPKDVYTCDLNELKKGDRIKMDITAAYECVMANETITYHGDEEEIKERSRYYAIPLIEENENSTNIYSFLVVEVSEENYTALDTATRLFEGWWNDSSGLVTYPDEILTTVDGVLKTANDEERAYIYAHFDDGEYVIPYVLYCRTEDGDMFVHILVCALILGGIIFTVKGFIEEGKARKTRTIVANSGYYNLPENVSFDHEPDQSHNP